MCFHKFVDGFGGMDDAVVCVKCNYSKYPEVLSPFTRLFCPVVKNDGTYGHRETFPYVVKFATKITFGTDFERYDQYFDKTGELIPYVHP